MQNFKLKLLLLIILLFSGINGTAIAQDIIPAQGYERQLPNDPAAIYNASYTYEAVVREIYDSDTLNVDLDLGLKHWVRDTNVRLAGTNAYEIKRSKSKTFRDLPIDSAHVLRGFECRDLMIEWLGGDPANFKRKVGYHDMLRPQGFVPAGVPDTWIKYGGPRVVVQTINDASGKYGRPLVIIWKDGKNLNQYLVRSGCADLQWYDGNEYAANSPITPR